MARPKRTTALSRDAIVDEAIGIVADEGLSALTMRAVAARLGVTPMAAYYYVADKEELMSLMSERISSMSGSLNLESGEDWEVTLKLYLLKLWENSTKYPGLGSYLINQPDLGVTSDRFKSEVRFFEEIGFTPKRAGLAWSFAMTYIHGRISVDAHLAHQPAAPRQTGLRARDYVEFGINSVVTALRIMLESDAVAAAASDDGPRRGASQKVATRAGRPG
ncbi:MAG: TetR/AcrR family transcriptional regulator [Acidimicrobiales bacterium]